MLTTTDNPYSPITEYDEWERFDALSGYNLPRLVARVYDTIVGHTMITDDDQAWAEAEAQVVEQNVYGNIVYVATDPDDGVWDLSGEEFDDEGYIVIDDNP